MGKCFVDRAAFGDLSKSFTLRVIEVTFYMNVGRDFLDETLDGNIAVFAVISVYARKIVAGAYGLQGQFLELAIPGNCDAGAGGKRTEQQFIGIRSGISAPGVDRLVSLLLVSSVRQLHGHARCQCCGDASHWSSPEFVRFRRRAWRPGNSFCAPIIRRRVPTLASRGLP